MKIGTGLACYALHMNTIIQYS